MLHKILWQPNANQLQQFKCELTSELTVHFDTKSFPPRLKNACLSLFRSDQILITFILRLWFIEFGIPLTIVAIWNNGFSNRYVLYKANVLCENKYTVQTISLTYHFPNIAFSKHSLTTLLVINHSPYITFSRHTISTILLTYTVFLKYDFPNIKFSQ